MVAEIWSLLMAVLWCASPTQAQSINLDFGIGDGPSSDYAAAGRAGYWNSLIAGSGTTTAGMLDLAGQPTSVSLTQVGGTDTPTVVDPETTGDNETLMDDYLVTFTSALETCIFLDGLAPGVYEVLIYARMPSQPMVLSETFVDQEVGSPHYEVGGSWPGGHQELVTYSRHLATVGVDGNLDFHSGIVNGGNEADGAALNGAQILLTNIFADGFESGNPSAWGVGP